MTTKRMLPAVEADALSTLSESNQSGSERSDEIDRPTDNEVLWLDPGVMTALLGPPRTEKGWTPGLVGLVAQFGVASLFAVNGVVAFIKPEDFSSLLEVNPVGGLLPAGLIGAMVWGAGLNDLALAAAIASGRNRAVVWVWMALWLVLISGVKLTNLLFA